MLVGFWGHAPRQILKSRVSEMRFQARRGLYTGGAYTWTIFCVSVIVINKYSNSDKQVLSIVIIVINSGNSDKQ
jgi:hypothetical protein